MSYTITRKDIKTIGTWTLQHVDYGDGDHGYFIKTDGKPAVRLYVDHRLDLKTDHMAYIVEYSPYSRPMDLEEAAEYVVQAQQALDAAIEFQQAINAIEGGKA